MGSLVVKRQRITRKPGSTTFSNDPDFYQRNQSNRPEHLNLAQFLLSHIAENSRRENTQNEVVGLDRVDVLNYYPTPSPLI